MSSTNSTPATPASAATVVSEITSVLNSAGSIAATVDPAIAPFVVLGQAAAAAAPGLIADIQALIDNTAPTSAQGQALAAQIQALASPQTL